MLDDAQVAAALTALPEWELRGAALVRTLQVDGGFSEAVAFAGRLAVIADEADHHPDLTISWNRIQVTWTTHSAGGLTERDLAMAAATDRLLSR